MGIIAEVSWDDVATGNLPESPVRQAFREAVEAVAQKAREALPEANGRIDAAVKIVLQGDVKILPDRKAKVASQSNGTTKYSIVNGTCECRDFEKAPGNFCKHRLAYGIFKRASALGRQQLEATLDSKRPEPPPVAPVALPEAPASANVYIEIAGRKVQITLRDQSEAQLLVRMQQLLQRFPAEDETEPTTPPEGWCPIHHCQMKHYSNQKGSWWSHRLPNNAWCRGK